jgi:hypothetical protein
MDSDVKLVPGQVRVEACDLCIDSPDRRKKDTPTAPDRRALVHDFGDGLTINWAGDYPGGVTINGDAVRVVGKLEITTATFEAPTTVAGTGTKATGKTTGAHVGPLVASSADTIDKTLGSVRIGSLFKKYLGSGPVDVVQAFAKLIGELDSVKQQLAAAQQNWRWCKKCRCLFFAGNPATTNDCAAGGQHTLEGSGNYSLMQV